LTRPQRSSSKLEAAGWRVAAARAERFPAIRLTGRIESNKPTAEALFDDWFSTLAGSLTSPLFNAGASRATIRQNEAVLRERFAAYRETLINAVQEVEQALNLEHTQATYAKAVTVRLDAAQQAYDEAVSRYRNGAVDYTTVLFQLNTLQQLERAQISAHADQIAYRIAL
jgi:outer membrane protein TolC